MAVLFFSACKREESVNIDQNRIYAAYAFTFDADKNKSTATATFRLDNSSGKKLELSYPARVDFNGEILSWRNALGYYEISRSGNEGAGSFNYFDLDDHTFSNEVSSLNAIEIPFGLTNISQSGNFFLPWTGAALQSGETIKVTISGGAQSISKSWTIGTVGSTHIILNQSKLDDLVIGTAVLRIERESSKIVGQSNLSGGRLTSKYLSRKVNVNISN